MTQSMATKKWQPRVQKGRAVKSEVATSLRVLAFFLLKPNTFLLNLWTEMYRDGFVLALPQAPPFTVLSLCDHQCFADPCLSLVQKESSENAGAGFIYIFVLLFLMEYLH